MIFQPSHEKFTTPIDTVDGWQFIVYDCDALERDALYKHPAIAVAHANHMTRNVTVTLKPTENPSRAWWWVKEDCLSFDDEQVVFDYPDAYQSALVWGYDHD